MFGWQPDAPDPRDEEFAVSTVLSTSKEPPPPHEVSNRDLVRGMFDQLRLSSCVGNAFSRADHMLEVAAFNAGKIDAIPEPSSRLFHYYNSRYQTGDTKRDNGTFIRLCVRQANELGVPPESLWPYKPFEKVNGDAMWSVKPTLKTFQYASADRVRSYRRIAGLPSQRIEEIRHCIAQGLPIIFGTYIAKSFVNNDGPLTIGPPGIEPIAGGHAMVMIGYDDEGVLVCNSWSADWRDQGFAKLTWGYVTWSGTRDIWALS